MRLNILLHEKEKTAKTPLVKRSILAEAHVECRLRPRHDVFDVFNLSYRGVSGIHIRRRDGSNLSSMVIACLGGLRTETWEEGTPCTPARDSARADASDSLRAVELRGEAPISAVLATKVGFIVSSGRAANAATFWIERRRSGRENMMIEQRSSSYE